MKSCMHVMRLNPFEIQIHIGTKVLSNISQPTSIHHLWRTRSLLFLAFSCTKAGFWLSGKDATRAEIFNEHQIFTAIAKARKREPASGEKPERGKTDNEFAAASDVPFAGTQFAFGYIFLADVGVREAFSRISKLLKLFVLSDIF